MKNLIATVKSNYQNLEVYADRINNGRTDGIYFYVNSNRVSVSYTYSQLNEKSQIEELEWFLKGKEFQID